MQENTIIELRKVEVEILDEIHNLCVKHGLTYYLCGGSLLGAVRHQGFIPWDDDTDIMMPRKDYEQFVKICLKGELGEKYFLQNTDTEKDYHLSYAKVRKNNTLFDEEGVHNLNIHKGIFVDVFPLDYSKKNYGVILKYRDTLIKNLVHVVSIRQLGKEAVSLLNKMLYFITRPLSVHRILKIADFIASCKKSGKYYVNFASYYNYTREINPVEYYQDKIKMRFENKEYFVPKGYDDILRTNFGNYMELPPEEERVNHNAAKILFDVKQGE